MENSPKYIILIHFDNKGLEYIHLNSILHKNNIINFLYSSNFCTIIFTLFLHVHAKEHMVS